jgi:hypothetical protein
LKDFSLDITPPTSIGSRYLPRIALSAYEMYALLISFIRRSYQPYMWSLALLRLSTFLRRNTIEIPSLWLSLYGNDRKQQLHLSYHQLMSLRRSTMTKLLQCIRGLFANSSLLLLLPPSKDETEVLLLIRLNNNYCRSPLL